MVALQTAKILNMKANEGLTIYQQAQHYAEVTKNLIANGNIVRAKKCFQLAENIFVNGPSEIKNVVSNIYLYSVTRFMEMQRYNVRGLLPDTLRNEYIKQVNTSGL